MGMKGEFYRLRMRALEDLGEAEAELEAVEHISHTPDERAHLRKALDRVRTAICTTLVMQMDGPEARG